MAEHKKTLFKCLKCGSQQLRTAGAKKCLDCRTGKITALLGIEARIKPDADGMGFSGTFKLTDAGLKAFKEKRTSLDNLYDIGLKPGC